jgi:two-component system KDP operon response regulator KdpE
MTQPPSPLILVVEDEPPVRRFLRAALGAHGFRVLEAASAQEARAALATHKPEVVLLDLGLPDADGIALTQELRGWCPTPIVVLSARDQEDDKVRALDAGADDYLTKPFGTQELLARLRVALRRASASAPSLTSEWAFGDLRLDAAKREVWRAGERLHLTPTEYALLLLLARHAGRVLTHRQILKEVWGPAYVEHTHYVRVHMAELRKKIEPDPARPRLLLTEPSVGYRLSPPEP